MTSWGSSWPRAIARSRASIFPSLVVTREYSSSSLPASGMARAIVKSGQLGELAYCRIDSLDALDLVHFVFDDEAPLSARVQRGPSGALVTYRYPRAVVSCEPGSSGTSFHGSRATLLIDQNGCRIFGQDGMQAAIADTGEDELVGHWRDWLECQSQCWNARRKFCVTSKTPNSRRKATCGNPHAASTIAINSRISHRRRRWICLGEQ